MDDLHAKVQEALRWTDHGKDSPIKPFVSACVDLLMLIYF